MGRLIIIKEVLKKGLLPLSIMCTISFTQAFGESISRENTPITLDMEKILNACHLPLLQLSGNSNLERQITELQKRFVNSVNPAVEMERLGWLYVAKARQDNDPGYYKVAETCARCLENTYQRIEEANLLQGHIYHYLHRFQDAELLARRLVNTRGIPSDFGLLGDSLMEQGKLKEASEAYQKMIDLKPGLESYSRVADIRWLKGDLYDAIGAMSMAVQAGSHINPEPKVWAITRLAFYLLQKK